MCEQFYTTFKITLIKECDIACPTEHDMKCGGKDSHSFYVASKNVFFCVCINFYLLL